MKYIGIYLSLLLIIACQSQQKNPLTVTQEDNSFQMPKVAQPDRDLQVALLIMDGVYNTELTAPMDIFQHTIYHAKPGMKVFTIAKNKELVTTFEGLKIIPDYSYKNDDYPPIDVLVVPSAEHHLDTDLEDTEMIQFVKETGDKAQYVLSLCDGAFVLAKSGLLDGYESTTFPGDIKKYKEMFPNLKVHEEVLFVHHGKFITSAGGAKSFEPALYLAELLYGKKAADGMAKGMVIDWDVSKIKKVIVE